MKNFLKKVLAVLTTASMACAAFAVTVFADGETGSSAQEAGVASQWLNLLVTIGPFVLIAIVFYFLLIRPQKKQEKEAQAMRNSISVGDTITTIGGITGTVLSVKEDEDVITLETGADRNRITVKKWAVQSKDKSAGE